MARLTQVVLIGDSIRMGYRGTVATELADIAEVWSPEENCRHSAFILEHLKEWVLDRSPGIVHVNAGIHDTAILEEGQRQIPFSEYRENVEKILKSILAEPGIRPVWATMTPILTDRANRDQRLGGRWTEDDVRGYNAAAVEIANGLGVPVNDLYAVVMAAPPERIIGQDGVHYTPEGSVLLGTKVAEYIRGMLED